MAYEAYPEALSRTIEDACINSFLRGCKKKRAALNAMDKNPVTLQSAISQVKGPIHNQNALYGASNSLRQVTFADHEGMDEGVAVRKVEASSPIDSKLLPMDQLSTVVAQLTKLVASLQNDLGPRARDQDRGHPLNHAVSTALQLAILAEIAQKKHYFIKLTSAERPDLRSVLTKIGQLARPVEKSGTLSLCDEIAVIADTCFEPDPLKISAEFARRSTPVAASVNCVLNKEVTVIAHTCPAPDPILLATSVQPTKGATLTISVSIRGAGRGSAISAWRAGKIPLRIG